MKLIKVTYSRTYQVCEYQPETFMLEMELDSNEEIFEAIDGAKALFEEKRTKL